MSKTIPNVIHQCGGTKSCLCVQQMKYPTNCNCIEAVYFLLVDFIRFILLPINPRKMPKLEKKH